MTQGYWAIRKYRSGPIGESIKYWIPGSKPERMTRQVRRDIRKAMKNSTNAIRTACRLVNDNFREGDGLLGLDYSEQAHEALTSKLEPGLSQQERGESIYRLAQHRLELAIRRVQYAMKKDGLELLCFSVTSDLDDKTSEPVRIHHHLIVSEASKPYFMQAWHEGGADWEPLSSQPDYTPIVAYLLKQVRYLPDAKKYRSSRNMKRQQPEDRIAMGGAEIRPPRGAVLLDRGSYQPGQPQYIRYILPDQFKEADTQLENGLLRVKKAYGHLRRPAAERDGERAQNERN